MVTDGRFARATGQGCDGLHGWKRALARIVERSHPDCRKPLVGHRLVSRAALQFKGGAPMSTIAAAAQTADRIDYWVRRHLIQLLALQPAKLLAPPIIRHFAHPDLADCVRYGLPLRDQNIDLPQLRNDLFRLVSLPCHYSPP